MHPNSFLYGTEQVDNGVLQEHAAVLRRASRSDAPRHLRQAEDTDALPLFGLHRQLQVGGSGLHGVQTQGPGVRGCLVCYGHALLRAHTVDGVESGRA